MAIVTVVILALPMLALFALIWPRYEERGKFDSFEEKVFKEELKKHTPQCPRNNDCQCASLDKNKLTGLAFSGGGIRSATFNLGIIQALANRGLLDKFDYLSTVSGGGYIGSWLMSWAYRKEQENTGTTDNGITQVQKILKENRDSTPDTSKSEPEPVAWLRRYSNYLTPRKGLFSLDTLTGVTYHIRNVFLSSLTTGLFIFGSMAFLAGVIKASGNLHDIPDTSNAAIASLAGLTTGFLATVWLWYRLSLVSASIPPKKVLVCSFLRKWAVEIIALLVVLHSIILGVIGLSPLFYLVGSIPPPESYGFCLYGGLILSIGYLVAVWLGITLARIKSGSHLARLNWRKLDSLSVLGAAPFFVLGGYLHKIPSWIGFEQTAPSLWELSGIFAPLFCLLISFAVSVHLGIVGRAVHSEAYFWVSRVAGRIMQFSILFAFPAVAFLVFPTLLDWSEAKLSIGGAGVIFAIVARLIAASPSTGRTNDKQSKWKKMAAEGVISVAPFVLILLLIGFAASGVRDAFIPQETWSHFNNAFLNNYQYSCKERTVLSKEAAAKISHVSRERIESNLQDEGVIIASGCIPSLKNYYQLNIDTLKKVNHEWALLSGFIFAALAMIFARLINANLFSLHSYYKNRLTNTYLAASNKKKDRDVDIGFHHSDAINLQDFGSTKPYFLVNTTLNLVGKENNLAWQDRKAASFIMSPLYCGYAIESIKDGYEERFQPTSAFANDPIKLNLAMTISGAAGSPMGGFHTKPGVSMLLALAGVRLGWWLPNPAIPEAWHGKLDAWLGNPDTSLLTTFPKELFGNADEEGNVVYLSDGGHFENLGIYELVRRRCALIVASDASADPDFVFDDLARAIHNIRTDFGVEIDIDVSSLRPQKNSTENKTKYWCSQSNFVIGKIKYSKSSKIEFKNMHDGDLIYIKSSLPQSAENNAVDVLYYASTHENFPHEPTSDQWFSEEQFEAYRKLGFLIGEDAAISIDSLRKKLWPQ